MENIFNKIWFSDMTKNNLEKYVTSKNSIKNITMIHYKTVKIIN